MPPTQPRTLGAPILDEGIRSINFFNGRLLSGEDLTQEQAAQRKARGQLGQAGGDGVAYGLEVIETPGTENREVQPVITVGAGLAVNRLGQPLALSNPVDVALTRPSAGGASAPVTGLFSDCAPTQAGAYVSGKGVYLLTIGATTGADGGRVPASGLGNIQATCNTRYQTEGVQFRLIQLPISAGDLSDEARLRNRVAYQCFGLQDDEAADFFANPFGPVVAKYGLLDDLRPDCLADSEVPLAVIFWTIGGGIRFVDHWAVRRRMARRPAGREWPLLISDRRAAEAEAMFLQFQEQIEAMRGAESSLAAIAAAGRFDFLPPLGLVPIQDTNSPGGFDRDTFFGDKASGDVALIDARLLRELLHTSCFHEPIDLSRDEKIQLYLIYENLLAVQAQQAPQLALVFASPALPYRGVARFGHAAWRRSRFAPRVI